MISVSERLAVMFADPGYRTLARSIIGSDDPQTIAGRLDEVCHGVLGARVSATVGVAMSVGAVFELVLKDSREVAVKIHGPHADALALAGSYRAMDALAEGGMPCPRLLCDDPITLDTGTAVIMTRLPAPPDVDVAVNTRRTMMAHALADLIRRARPLASLAGLPGPRSFESPWPVPHNALFDFEGTRVGAEWIDEIGTATASMLDKNRGEVVLGHADWSGHNVRCTPHGVAAIYDGDSLRLDAEAVFAGNAAITACLDARSGFPFEPPSPREALAFVAAYEQARGDAFAARMRRIAMVAAVRQIAYIARCSHALRMREEDSQPGPMERALPGFQRWL